MKTEIKNRWVSALRSGEYSQGQSYLKTPKGDFCCLGVLCDMFLKDHNREWVEDSRGEPYFKTETCSEYHHLPREVYEWAGISSFSPTVKTPEGEIELVTLNDEGVSFNEIANYIEVSEVV